MNEERLTEYDLSIYLSLVNSCIIPPKSDKGKMILELIANRSALLATQNRVAELEKEVADLKDRRYQEEMDEEELG